MKLCIDCKIIKPVDRFSPAGVYYSSYCKPCVAIRTKNHRDAMTEFQRKAFLKKHRQMKIIYRTQPRNKKRQKEYLKTYYPEYMKIEANKQRLRERSKLYKINHPEKCKAHTELASAIKRKQVIKPKVCSQCGIVKAKIHGHHYLGYAPKHWLDIQWLCVSCHESIHHPNCHQELIL